MKRIEKFLAHGENLISLSTYPYGGGREEREGKEG